MRVTPRPSRSRLLASLGAAAALAASPARASACAVKGGGAGQIDVNVTDLETSFPEISTKLAKGLAVTILHEARRERDGAAFVFGCRVNFDLWADSYAVTVLHEDKDGNAVAAGPAQTVADKEKALNLCKSGVATWTLAKTDAVAVVTVVDPISPEQEAKTREWLAAKGIGGSSAAIFGRAAATLTNFHQAQSKARACEVLP